MKEEKTITFKFDGKSISMDALGGALIQLVGQVYNLVQACSDEEARILSIENNCVKMTFARTVVASMAILGGAGEGVRDVAKYNAASRAINAMLVKREATLEIWDTTGATVRKFDGKRTMPEMPEERNVVKATMAVYGELLDVGGVEPNIHIKSDSFKESVKLKVEKEDARKLGKRLYNQIGVNAAVKISEGKVIDGKVLEVIDYEPEDMGEWIAKNKDNMGIESFRGIDIASFIEEQRM